MIKMSKHQSFTVYYLFLLLMLIHNTPIILFLLLTEVCL